MGKLASLVVVVALLGLCACAAERAEERPKPAAEESRRVKLFETRPNPGPVQSWQPPPVWLVSGGEAVQASYDGFCELDVCIGAESPERRGDAPATVEIDARKEVLVVVGSDGVRQISVGVKGWDDEPNGPPDDPGILTGAGIPYYMRKLDSPPGRSQGERPVVEHASGGATTAFELASTGRKGDRLLTVFLRTDDGSNSAVYHWRLNPGEEGENPPPEEKDYPGDLVEVASGPETEVHPPEEAAKELEVGSVERLPFGGSAARIEAGEDYLWVLGVGQTPDPQYPRDQYRPQGGSRVASDSAASADDAGPFGDELLKVDPGTGEILSSANVPGAQGAVEVDAGAIWAAGGGGTLLRLDAGTGDVAAEIPVCFAPNEMASAAGSLWVACYDDTQSGRVVRVGPATNEVVAEVETPGVAESVAVDGETGDVWAVALDSKKGFIDYENNQLVRIDPETNEISQRLKVEGGVSDVVAGEGEVWVANTDGELSRIDPEKGQVVSIVKLTPERGPYATEIGAGSLWAASVDTFWRVDLESGRPLGSAKVGEYGAEDLTVDDEGNVWLAGMGTLTRVASR